LQARSSGALSRNKSLPQMNANQNRFKMQMQPIRAHPRKIRGRIIFRALPISVFSFNQWSDSFQFFSAPPRLCGEDLALS
jgi:hypothetical protein